MDHGPILCRTSFLDPLFTYPSIYNHDYCQKSQILPVYLDWTNQCKSCPPQQPKLPGFRLPLLKMYHGVSRVQKNWRYFFIFRFYHMKPLFSRSHLESIDGQIQKNYSIFSVLLIPQNELSLEGNIFNPKLFGFYCAHNQFLLRDSADESIAGILKMLP